MKNFLLFTLFISSIFITQVYSQSGWDPQNSPNNEDLNDIDVWDDNTGYIVGGNSTILKTTNGGTYWSLLPVTPNFVFNSVKCINANTVWVTGNNGVLLTTTNSGINWIIKNSGTNYKINEIHFQNVNTGWIAGDNGIIKMTTNSGNNWISQNSGTTYNLNSVHFVDDNTGWAVGNNGTVIKTTNSGYSWVFQILGIVLFNKIRGHTPNAVMSVGNEGKIFRTTNGGTNWNQIPSITSNNLKAFFLGYILLAWIVGNHGIILNSTDDGISWQQQNSGTNKDLNAVDFSDDIFPVIGWAVGKEGTILKTTTGGVGIKPISNEIPSKFSLHQNYPNPFNPTTEIKFDVTKSSLVKIIIYNILGEETTTILDNKLYPGSYKIDWDGTDYPSGVYFYKLVTDDFVDVKKMILIK